MVDRLFERHVGVYIIRACADDTFTSIYWDMKFFNKLLDPIERHVGVYIIRACVYFALEAIITNFAHTQKCLSAFASGSICTQHV